MILEHLYTTQATLLSAIDGLSEAQWRFVPAHGGWSIAQIIEHVTLVERSLHWLLTERLPAAPAPSSPYTPAQRRARLLRLVPDRSRRVPTPDRNRPAGAGATFAESRDAFLAARAALMTVGERNDQTLAEHVLPHPFLGDLDGHEWLLFASLHVQRHASQIDEVKQAEGYPGG